MSKTKTTTTRRPPRLSATRRRRLTELAHGVVRQMGRTDTAVAAALKKRPKANWQSALPEIAAAAFSDAFTGMCAVEVLRNPNGHKMVDRFLRVMRHELEDRERSWDAQTTARLAQRAAGGAA